MVHSKLRKQCSRVHNTICSYNSVRRELNGVVHAHVKYYFESLILVVGWTVRKILYSLNESWFYQVKKKKGITNCQTVNIWSLDMLFYSLLNSYFSFKAWQGSFDIFVHGLVQYFNCMSNGQWHHLLLKSAN